MLCIEQFSLPHFAFAILDNCIFSFLLLLCLVYVVSSNLTIFNSLFNLIADELMDRNSECCVTCCIDYEGWLQFQNCLYGIVKDPLFELFITTCIVLNTLFLALEHHGMSENVRQVLDVGNKVNKEIYCYKEKLVTNIKY